MTEQRRARAIAMTAAECDDFLQSQPICRVATLGPSGHPHTSPLWFVWDGTALWFNSLVRSQRWTDISRDPRISAIVDDGGTDFGQLRGIELRGRVEVVGETPRTGEPVDVLTTPERLFADKYMGGQPFRYDGRHSWLRLTPDRVISWDFARLRRRH